MTKESTSHQVNEKQSGNERQQLKQGPCWVNKYQPKYVGKVLVPSQHTVMCLFAKLLRFCFFYDPKGSNDDKMFTSNISMVNKVCLKKKNMPQS